MEPRAGSLRWLAVVLACVGCATLWHAQAALLHTPPPGRSRVGTGVATASANTLVDDALVVAAAADDDAYAPTTDDDGVGAWHSEADAAAQQGPLAAAAPALSAVVSGRRVAVLIHELTASGAPRVATELCRVLEAGGAFVLLLLVPQRPRRTKPGRATRGGNATALARWDAAGDAKLSRALSRLFPALHLRVDWAREGAGDVAAVADVVVANTAAPWMARYVARFKDAHPAHRGLVWYLHEARAVMRDFAPRHTAAVVRLLGTPDAVDGVLFVSWATEQFWRGALARAGHASLPRVARVLHWGVPAWLEKRLVQAASDAPSRARLRASLGIAPDDTVFLALAYFSPLKGHAGMLRSFAAARALCPQAGELHFVAAGAGHRTDAWLPDAAERAAVRADPRIHLLPPVSRPEAYLAAADAYVSNTQLGGGESWGLATLEAAVAGKVLLAPRLGGALEQQRHGVTALLHHAGAEDGDGVPILGADAGPPDELARNMCAVATNATLTDSLATAGQRHAMEHFGQAATEGGLAGVLAAVLGRRGGGGGAGVEPAATGSAEARRIAHALARPIADAAGSAPCGVRVVEPGGVAVVLQPAPAHPPPPPPATPAPPLVCLGASHDGSPGALALPPGALPSGAAVAYASAPWGGLLVVAGGVVEGAGGAPTALALARLYLLPSPDEVERGLLDVVALPPLPAPRQAAAACVRVVGGEGEHTVVWVRVLGGAPHAPGHVVGTHWLLGLRLAGGGGGWDNGTQGGTPAWAVEPPLPLPVAGAGCAWWGGRDGGAGRVYVAGGARGCPYVGDLTRCGMRRPLEQHPVYGELRVGAGLTASNAVWAYHEDEGAGGAWERLADLRAPGEAVTVAVGAGGETVAVGGGGG